MNSDGNPVCSSPVRDYLEQLHAELSGVTEGQPATYIPELAKANPNWFGICLVTASGAVYEVGDSRQQFTIQSISKPFVYGLALEDCGRSHVLTKIGLEPTGDAFNSISLDPSTGQPRNPMINAGAIAAAGLIAGKTANTRFTRVLEMLGAYAGRGLTLDSAVYQSESETGHRNRAIGYMLRNFDILTDDPTPSVELYFKQCSVSVSCRDLGIMAATLANGGINPLTRKQAIRGEYIESVLSVMGSCGMYNYAGEWIYKIGMPAKSGVAGGIIAVLPGQLGIGVFSPPLDAQGNSVRGIRVCDRLSHSLDLHLFNRPSSGQSVIRLKFTGAEVSSSRMRTSEESQALARLGSQVRVYHLQGHLIFTTAEVVVSDIINGPTAPDFVLLDLKRVLSLNESACHLFYQLLLKLWALRKSLAFTHVGHLPLLRRLMKRKLAGQYEELFRVFEDMDPALEWCENQLLDTAQLGLRAERTASVREYDLFDGLSGDELAIVGSLLRRHAYAPGTVIIQAGDDAQELFFVARGIVSVLVTLGSGALKRLASFSAGMAFGEMAILDRAPRSATVKADTEVECDLLTLDDLTRLGESWPGIKIKLSSTVGSEAWNSRDLKSRPH